MFQIGGARFSPSVGRRGRIIGQTRPRIRIRGTHQFTECSFRDPTLTTIVLGKQRGPPSHRETGFSNGQLADGDTLSEVTRPCQ